MTRQPPHTPAGSTTRPIVPTGNMQCGNKQSGVGLIEVMIALFILAFGALAIGNVQMSALFSVQVSSSHYAINNIAEGIAEHLKADPFQASTGIYNTVYTETAGTNAMPVTVRNFVSNSKVAAATELKDGELQIDCTTTECTVSLRWSDFSIAGQALQFYNLRVPLHFN